MCVAWNQFNIFSASSLGQLFVLCRNWGKNVGLDLAQLQYTFSVLYSNVVDCGGVLIMTPKRSQSFDLFMRWTFFVQFHFTEHEGLLGEGEKWGENKTKSFTYLWAGKKKTQGLTSTSENTAF